ncbi:helix-turn-helix domain-containing protein [Arachidicoccus soli]|uniref:XRE family transcriptional regulator n=1 Tax=Arachidicoccus soli TaxID=2341117 RepID=A0A386HP84_9BACT|nr:helix-turn-helix transcriptional regulator [Arachidicoccus soli]AYD47396.1 XRE family transcriptional regulator [Arachidicoccus soli]
MAKYHDIEFTKKVGVKIRLEREASNLSIEDVAEITGFHRNVIISIENGSNTDISHIAGVAFALNLHPKILLDVEVDIKPRFQLSGTRREKSKLTPRIGKLYNSGYFNIGRTSKEVCTEILEKYPESIKVETKNVSVILRRFCDNGKLQVLKKKGYRYNFYQKKK